MKRYLICDDNDVNTNYVKNYEELLDFFLSELQEDTINCYDNSNLEGVKYNIEIFKKIAKEHFQEQLIIKELAPFGWYVQDLSQLQRDLSNFQAYKHGSGSPCIPNDCIEQTLKMIESEMNK